MEAKISPDLEHLAVPIEELVLDPRNARKHSDKSVKALVDALRRFGQQKPIVVDSETGTVKAGNGLLQAARELGWERIARVRSDLSGQVLDAYAIHDNRTAEKSEWDGQTLQEALSELEDAGVADREFLGFTDEELQMLSRVPEVDKGASTKQASDTPSSSEKSFTLSYSLVFNTLEEQEVWFEFMKFLKESYEADTISERIVAYLNEKVFNA